MQDKKFKKDYKKDNRQQNRFQKKEVERREKHIGAKRCPHCGHCMRARGASNSVGCLSWKCRNKKCGRTVWKKIDPTPPTPLAPTPLLHRRY